MKTRLSMSTDRTRHMTPAGILVLALGCEAGNHAARSDDTAAAPTEVVVTATDGAL